MLARSLLVPVVVVGRGRGERRGVSEGETLAADIARKSAKQWADRLALISDSP
jgi:hypothetical protein